MNHWKSRGSDMASLNKQLTVLASGLANHVTAEVEQKVAKYQISKDSLADNRFPFNPNGSINDIAGICDPTGRIFGLMPHPEAFNHWTNHPDWTRDREIMKRRGKKPDSNLTPGICILKNGVDFICNR